jgi:hypothetical protein
MKMQDQISLRNGKNLIAFSPEGVTLIALSSESEAASVQRRLQEFDAEPDSFGLLADGDAGNSRSFGVSD